ncbi:peptidoglycan editing factor PgeF [Lewinella cohaerens]|uniref:peptidoglycan editing factor PgeF n=1 Tax=Lewinella cohaerens TaxID=70995 RepID=UPI00035C45BE|nr:peptidoglycan editing factor PgeF [Lewinella cohaerens]
MLAETNYQPSWASSFPKLTIAESTRLGGVSLPPFSSLNLGLFTDDKTAFVKQNRERFCRELNWDTSRLAGSFQVHSDQVLRVNTPGEWEGYDALVTNRPDILLSITIADCTPVLIYDPISQSVGAAHAGWKGTAGQIAAKTMMLMRDAYGTRPENCWVYIGTCIAERDFEVDADVADHFSEEDKRWHPQRKKFLVDLKKANRDQFLHLGVAPSQIELSPFSTVEDNDRYFSHRAERGSTGRMLAVIGLKP